MARFVTAGFYLAVVAVFLASLTQFYHRGTGFTTLIHFGDRFYDRTLAAVRYAPHATAFNSAGDDGQFYAQLAVEPLLRNRQLGAALDNAPYRARRILFPWIANLFGLGRPAWVLQAYAVENVVAWLAMAWLLCRWLPPSRPRHALPWVGCLLGVGLVSSVRLAMIDGPAMLIVMLAILALERGRPWLAAVVMGVCGLGRETSLSASGMLVNRWPRTWVEWRHTALKAAIVLCPFLLWSIYVRSVFPGFSYVNPDSFGVPFSGYVTAWRNAIRAGEFQGWRPDTVLPLAILIGIGVQAGFIAARWRWSDVWWRMAAPSCVLFAMTSYAVWGGFPGAASRVLLPLTLSFNVLVARERGWAFWVPVVLGNLSVLAGLSLLRVPGLGTAL